MFELIFIPFNNLFGNLFGNLLGKTPIYCTRNKCKNIIYYSEYESIENIEGIQNINNLYCSKYCKEYNNFAHNIV
jgi:hypothetical protein